MARPTPQRTGRPLGVVVKNKRKALSYSRTKLAALLSVEPVEVEAWEDGSLYPGARTAFAFALLEGGYSAGDIPSLLRSFRLGYPKARLFVDMVRPAMTWSFDRVPA